MPEIVWQVGGFIVAISVLVCFHELGHYWVARRLGVKVLRFSLGWGKPFKTFRARDGVEWSIAPYPIGGYVKLLDELEVAASLAAFAHHTLGHTVQGSEFHAVVFPGDFLLQLAQTFLERGEFAYENVGLVHFVGDHHEVFLCGQVEHVLDVAGAEGRSRGVAGVNHDNCTHVDAGRFGLG